MKNSSEVVPVIESKYSSLDNLKARHEDEHKYEKEADYIAEIERILGTEIKNYNHRNMNFDIWCNDSVIGVVFTRGQIKIKKFNIEKGYVYIEKRNDILTSNSTFKSLEDAATFIKLGSENGYKLFYFQA